MRRSHDNVVEVGTGYRARVEPAGARSAAPLASRPNPRLVNPPAGGRRPVPAARAVTDDAEAFTRLLLNGLAAVGLGARPLAAANDPRVPSVIPPHTVLLDLVWADGRADAAADPRLGADADDHQPAVLILSARNVRELVGHVHAILHAPAEISGAHSPRPSRRRHVVGVLELDLDSCRALVNGKDVGLTALEMRLLTYLVEHPSQAHSRQDLLRNVWAYSPRVSSRSPDTHIRRLRVKLGVAGYLVETVRGMGYRLSAACAPNGQNPTTPGSLA